MCCADKMLLAGQAYKVTNAIFHHGTCIEKNHCTSMCREGTSWIEIDIDDAYKLQKNNAPKSARDIYILFLQKIITIKHIY